MKVNQLKTGAALSYISLGLSNVISIIYTPIMLRLLGQSEYGLYTLVSSIVAYLGILNFGFGSAYMRYYSRFKTSDDHKNIEKLNGMFLIIFTIIGSIALLAGLVLISNTDTILGNKLTTLELSKARILMAIMVINIAISFPNVVFNAHITANEQFVFQKLLQIIKAVVNPFVILPVLFIGYGSVGMVIVTTLLNISIEIVNIIFCFKELKMRFAFGEFDLLLMKEMTVFSSFIFINMVVDQVNWNIDKFIIGRFHGTGLVAIYGLAAQINTYYRSFSMAISSVFIPRVHKMISSSESNQSLTFLLSRIGRLQFIILSMIAIFFVFFGRPFLYLWAGQNYTRAYPIILLLILPVTVPLIQTLGIEIQRAKNMHKFRSWVYFFIALINLILSIPLARVYGGIGAAIGTATALIIGNGFVMNWYNHAKVGLDMKYFWKQIFQFIPSLIIPIIFGVAVTIFIDLYNILSLLICGSIFVLVYGISIWHLGMNKYEKNLIGNPVRSAFKRIISGRN
jgi:O-antigen/teichoic acid export membrane protein